VTRLPLVTTLWLVWASGRSWQADEVARYGELLRQEHALKARASGQGCGLLAVWGDNAAMLQHTEADAETRLRQCEAAVEARLGEYTAGASRVLWRECGMELQRETVDYAAMRERYHQEQLWSDKIRSLSTYGTLLVTVGGDEGMKAGVKERGVTFEDQGCNLAVLFVSLTAFEPRKRRLIIEGVGSTVAAGQRETEQFVHEEMKVRRGAVVCILPNRRLNTATCR
jgi:hypothetical protein